MMGQFICDTVKPSGSVLVAVEASLMGPEMQEMCSALRRQSDAVLMVYPDKNANEPNYPESVKRAMESSDVIIDCCKTTDMYSSFKQGLLEGRKIVYLLKPCGGMLDYYRVDSRMLKRIQSVTEELRSFLARSSEIEIAIGGSTIRASRGTRPLLVDGLSAEKGLDTILPPASVSFAPMEDSLEGTLEFSGFVETVAGASRSITAAGKVVMENGRITQCDSVIGSFFDGGSQCRTIGHITFGTNPFISNPTEGFDTERAIGGICLGFGNNQGSFQGSNTSRSHVDLAMKSSCIVLRNESGNTLKLGEWHGRKQRT